ncbi:MAG TPA: hypothetical protein VLY03_00330, partial [Bacteroidota bacterium]|nr:hypothetical protein [Bacteroidota bacterium]
MEQYLGLPPDGSAHGPAIDHLIGLMHWVMLVLFVGWGAFYLYTLIRFRKSKNPSANYTGVKSHVSNYLEVGVLLVEVILLVGFSIPLWSKRVDSFPAEKDAVVIRVVAEQFAWNIHYPGKDGKFGRTSPSLIDGENPLGLDRNDPDAKDDITTINQLNLPVDKPVIFYLSSKDVIHSFNLPAFRVKQDAIPGMRIPLWFTPTKTTDQIREEMTKTFSIEEAMKSARMVPLPEASMMGVSKGSSHSDMVLMQDYADTSGNAVASKGDRLTSDNMNALAAAGIPQVSARSMAKLDRYVSMEDVADSSGTAVVSKNDPLTEDAVTKIIAMGHKEIMARRNSNMDTYVVMQAYSDKSGNPIAQKGDPMSEDLISKLSNAGIGEIAVSAATPTEIACAQLCGLGHYRMRGYITVQSQDDFQKWYDAQEAAIAPPAAP